MRVEDRFAAMRDIAPTGLAHDLGEVRRRAASLRTRRRRTRAVVVAVTLVAVAVAVPRLTGSRGRRVVAGLGTPLPRPVPGWVPDGFTLTGAGDQPTVHADPKQWTTLWTDADDRFALRGRSLAVHAIIGAAAPHGVWAAMMPPGLSAPPPGVAKLRLNGHEAVLQPAAGDRLQAWWDDGNVRLELITQGLTRDELIAVAESVHVDATAQRVDRVHARVPDRLHERWSGHTFVGGDPRDQNSGLTYHDRKGDYLLNVGASVNPDQERRLPPEWPAWQAADGESVDINGASGVVTTEAERNTVTAVWEPHPGTILYVSMTALHADAVTRDVVVRVARSVRLVDETSWRRLLADHQAGPPFGWRGSPSEIAAGDGWRAVVQEYRTQDGQQPCIRIDGDDAATRACLGDADPWVALVAGATVAYGLASPGVTAVRVTTADGTTVTADVRRVDGVGAWAVAVPGQPGTFSQLRADGTVVPFRP